MASSPAPHKPADGFYFLFVVGLLVLAFFVFRNIFDPIHNGIHATRQNACVQTAHALNLAMFSYAHDNAGKYPDGKSSTEAFQKLLDGGYITEPAIFYVPMQGKTKALAGQQLKPENVSWDVTEGVDSSSPDQIPIVFLTGYKVSYIPGGAAVPLSKPFPRLAWEDSDPTFLERLFGWPPIRYTDFSRIAAAYKNSSSRLMKLETAPDGTGAIPNFIPPDFKPDGKAYRQLTPDGPLP